MLSRNFLWGTWHNKSYITEEEIGKQKQKQNNDAKGKRILSDKVGSNLEGEDMVSSSCNTEKLDEM